MIRSRGLILNYTRFQNVFTNINRYCRMFSSGRSEVNVIKSDVSDVKVPNSNVAEHLHGIFKSYYNYLAAVSPVTGKKYTYEQISAKSLSLGKVLRKKFKLSKGDVVGIYMQNDPDFIISALGILNAGLVVTTMSPLYIPDELSRQLLDSGVKLLITQSNFYNTAQRALQIAQKNIPVVSIKEKRSDSLPDGAICFEELLNAEINDIPDIVSSNLDDLAVLLYSSGTTGIPKGVQLTHLNILTMLSQWTHPKFNFNNKATDNYQDVIPTILPMFHIYGLCLNVLNSLCHGAQLVTLPRFTMEIVCNALRNYQITHLYSAPPLISFLTSCTHVRPEYFKSLQLVVCGAAPLKYSDEKRFLEKIKNNYCIIRQGYGLTETGPVTGPVIDLTNDTDVGGSIGKLFPNTMVKVVAPGDLSGTALGPNEPGELLVKGTQVMKGYLNRPEENKKAFQDGWFKTGDIVYYNENKLFFIVDRLKELIKVRGYQVSPAEIEAVIRTFPGVEDVAVIGIPHSVQGEAPRAYIVTKRDLPFKREDLQMYISKKLAKYKQLNGGIRVVDLIPRNSSGKILRRILKDNYIEKGI